MQRKNKNTPHIHVFSSWRGSSAAMGMRSGLFFFHSPTSTQPIFPLNHQGCHYEHAHIVFTSRRQPGIPVSLLLRNVDPLANSPFNVSNAQFGEYEHILMITNIQ